MGIHIPKGVFPTYSQFSQLQIHELPDQDEMLPVNDLISDLENS